jgi:predicted metal-dependent phosphotriesterase family hydrolase
MFIALLMKNGITEREIEYMAKENPSKLLDLQ